MSPPAVSSRRRPGTPRPSSTAVIGGGEFGPFRFLERIERGGPAELYRALWADAPVPSERACLVKRLRPELTSSPAFRRMFAEEARIMMFLRHAGVARVYAHGEIEGLPYLAMEPLDGISLARLLGAYRAAGKKMPLEVVAHIAQQVAAVLAHAHQTADAHGVPLGIVHRDVRPANIMLLTDGQVKLVEFGVARIASFVSQSANLAGAGNLPGQGKASYAAPEQLTGAMLDGRSDLFSLGVCLWEMLVGRPLFPPGSPSDLAARVLQAPVPRPSSVRPDISAALDEIVARLLERDLSRRLSTAEELAVRLSDLVPAPSDARRAVMSLVRTAAEAPMALPGTVTPGGRRGTQVAPPVAGVMAAPARMMAMAGRLPGSIRKVSNMVAPLSWSPLSPRGQPSSPVARVPHLPARWAPSGPSQVGKLAMQAALAATLAFVAGVLWQELRVDAAVARPISSALAPRSRAVIERLPSRSNPGSRAPNSTLPSGPGASAATGRASLALATPGSSNARANAKKSSALTAARKKALKSKRARQLARRRHQRL